jgi:hypothetical protein
MAQFCAGQDGLSKSQTKRHGLESGLILKHARRIAGSRPAYRAGNFWLRMEPGYGFLGRAHWRQALIILIPPRATATEFLSGLFFMSVKHVQMKRGLKIYGRLELKGVIDA